MQLCHIKIWKCRFGLILCATLNFVLIGPFSMIQSFAYHQQSTTYNLAVSLIPLHRSNIFLELIPFREYWLLQTIMQSRQNIYPLLSLVSIKSLIRCQKASWLLVRIEANNDGRRMLQIMVLLELPIRNIPNFMFFNLRLRSCCQRCNYFNPLFSLFARVGINNNHMSEIAIKDPSLRHYLQPARKQSPLSHQSNQQSIADDCSYARNKFGKNELFGSSTNSDTNTSKNSSPMKITPSMLRSSFNPAPSSAGLSRNAGFKTGTLDFFQNIQNIQEQEFFECQHDLQKQKKCQVCKGTGFVTGNNNLLKFFEYLIGFKLGINSSYNQKKTTTIKRVEVNNLCRYTQKKDQIRKTDIRITNSNYTYRIKTIDAQKPAEAIRSSLYKSARISERQFLNQSKRFSSKADRICTKDDVVQQLNSLVTIHQNYKCDICECSPIIGPRYHCQDCEDFDECQECYKRESHPHSMQKIEKTGKGKQLEHVITLLAQSNTPSIRTSLRPQPTIQIANASTKTTRSAIR